MKSLAQNALLAAAIFGVAAAPIRAEESAQTGAAQSQLDPHSGAILRGSKTVGAKVFTNNGEQMGSIDDVLLDPKSGQISYAVLGIGGFLGLGERKTLVPWDKIRQDTTHPENFIVEADKEKLRAAPSFEGDQWAAVTQPDYLRTVQTYFGGGSQPGQQAQQDAQKTAEQEARRRALQAQQQAQQKQAEAQAQQQQAQQKAQEAQKAQQESQKVQTPPQQ